MNKLLLLVCSAFSSAALSNEIHSNDIFDLSFEELLNTEVTTASNKKETLSNAPATVIVLEQHELIQRGYENISEVFDDLPGMEMIYTFGDTYHLNYMRGYRYTIGTPYLVMVDGKSINSLYYNKTTQLAAFPLSLVKRVEVVYGPASSVYGANAFMGVVNIITKDDNASTGVTAFNRVGSDGSLVADYAFRYHEGDVNARLGLRFEDAQLAKRIDNESNYWLQDRHFNDSLWGVYLTDPELMDSQFSSKIRNLGIAGSLEYQDWSMGFNYYKENSGYGTVYPADRLASEGRWPLYQYSAYVGRSNRYSDSIVGNTVIRYRSDGVDGDSYDLEAWNVTNSTGSPAQIGGVTIAPNETARMIYYQNWLSKNRSWVIQHDIDATLSDALSFVAGIKYEYKDLQKAYITTSSGPTSPLAEFTTLPPFASGAYGQKDNRATWEDLGLYIQSSYQFNSKHRANLGLRVDRNSVYGTDSSVRVAYVFNDGAWNWKALYGEAFHEPTARTLYGAWSGSGADPTLVPERSNTIEMNVRYTDGAFSHLLSLYRIKNNDTVISFTGGAENLGQRNVVGLDYHFAYSWQNDALGAMDLKVYASHYLKAEEQDFDIDSKENLGYIDIGDLAHSKLWVITNWKPEESWNVNLKARFNSSRDTVATNPIKQLGGYAVWDLVVTKNSWMLPNANISLRVTNLFNKQYFHPGTRDADAGDPLLDTGLQDSIGFSQDNPKAWYGSLGWYNSRLPQPERRFVLSLQIVF